MRQQQQRNKMILKLSGFQGYPENHFSGFLDPKNVGKDTKFITPGQIQMELYWV